MANPANTAAKAAARAKRKAASRAFKLKQQQLRNQQTNQQKTHETIRTVAGVAGGTIQGVTTAVQGAKTSQSAFNAKQQADMLAAYNLASAKPSESSSEENSQKTVEDLIGNLTPGAGSKNRGY